jgi:hypothetical protein
VRLCVLALVLLCGCGSPDEPVVALQWPLHTALTCAAAGVLDGLTATLKIAGQADCALSVSGDPKVVEGTCAGIGAGIERPLMVVYLSAQTLVPLPLAINFGQVDLRGAVDGSVVDVGLDPSLMVISDAVLQALPANLPGVAWGRQNLRDTGLTLDQDADRCANLIELCAGTLTDGRRAQCEP